MKQGFPLVADTKVFQIAVKGGGGDFTPSVGGIKIFTGVDFFTGWWEPYEEWFWTFFKTISVNNEHQLKSKFTWLVRSKSMKLIEKCYISNDYS